MWLSGPIEKDRLSITGIQVHCLTLLARQIFSVGGDLDFTVTRRNLPQMTVLQAEFRKRLWATILEFFVQASLDNAMLPRLSLDDFDTAAPSNMNDNDLLETTITTTGPHPKEVFKMTSIQILLLESMPTRLRMLKLLTGFQPKISYLDILALSTELIDGQRACNNFMSKDSGTDVKPFHRNIIYFLVRRFLILLHSSFANKAKTNPLFQYSLTISLETAITMISPEPDEAFSRLIAVGRGMFREGIRYAMTVIAVSHFSEVEDRRQNGTTHRNDNFIILFKQSMVDLVAFSAERIRQGETNIKGHMFLSMALAQAETMEAGTSCEYSIARSAIDSLKFSYDVLQNRAAGISGFESLHLASSGSFGYQKDLGKDFDFDFFMPDAGFL